MAILIVNLMIVMKNVFSTRDICLPKILLLPFVRKLRLVARTVYPSVDPLGNAETSSIEVTGWSGEGHA